jgi:LysR family transcriptional regulator, glycine cleavage system transcriptional activator
MKSLRSFHLNGLRAVEAAARLGGLAGAADELGVTPGAVSQHIIRTERMLGRAVFERTPHGLRLSPFGTAFAAQLHGGFQQLSAAVALAGNGTGNRLTVSVAPVFAAKWLVWRLDGFHREHPELQVRIDASVGLVDFDTSDVDVAVRVGKGGWPGVDATAFIGQTIFPVCSKAVAAGLDSPADLARTPVIRDANAMVLWDTWLAATGNRDVALAAGPTYSDAALCLDATTAGQGVMLGWPTLAADALAAGRLVMPFPLKVASGHAYWFVTPQNRPRPRKVAAFCDWLVRELHASLRDVPELADEVCDESTTLAAQA